MLCGGFGFVDYSLVQVFIFWFFSESSAALEDFLLFLHLLRAKSLSSNGGYKFGTTFTK